MYIKAQRDITPKLRILNHAKEINNIAKTCRYFGISRDTFYRWKLNYQKHGEEGLVNSKPYPENPKLRLAKPIEEKILNLRKNYHFGPLKITWYLERFHGIKVSRSGCYYLLQRYRLNRLPQNCRKRSIRTFKRYQKQMPGHRYKSM